MATSLSEFKNDFGIEDRMNPPKNIFELTSRLENEINKFPGYERSSDIGFSGVSKYIENYDDIHGWGESGFSGFSGVNRYTEDYGKSGYSGISGFSGYSGYNGISGFSGYS